MTFTTIRELSKRGLVIWTVSLSLLCATAARGQSGLTTGVLLGAITDNTGAAVPGASVSVTNSQTGLQRQAETDTNGYFRFGFLPPGYYKFLVQKPGFNDIVSDLIQVEVGVETPVNFKLLVKGVTTTVEVNASVLNINTTNAELGQVIQGTQITDLPLNFREFTQLALLAPGAVLDVRERIFPTKTGIVINGQRSQNGDVIIDGIESNESHWGGASLNFLDLDAIREFKVTTSNYSAELSGSSYNVRAVIKSGSNELHGTLYEFLRNDALDARDFFDTNLKSNAGVEIPGTARPPFRRNQFGGTAGGHIIKDRLFWFGDYEGLRQNLSQTAFAPVPTAAERQGTVITVNPVTGLQDTLTVPVAPAITSVLNRYVLPNDPNGAYGARTYDGLSSTQTTFNQYTGKIDWQKSNNSVSGAWSSYSQVGPGGNDLATGPKFGNDWIIGTQHGTLQYVHIFSPTVVNELSLGYHRDVGKMSDRNLTQSGANFADGAISGLNPGGVTFGTVTNNFELLDNVTYLHGRHALKAGAEVKNTRDAYLVALLFPGQFTFSQDAPTVAPIPTASGVTIPEGSLVNTSLVNFLMNAPYIIASAAITQGFPGPPGYNRVDQSAYEFFGQDDFKLSHKLTLNLGLRWEYYTHFVWRNRGNVNQVLGGPNEGESIFNPSASNEYDSDYHNFGPRVGFAYAYSPKTVVRSGFAVFTVPPIRQSTEGLYGFFPSEDRFTEFIPSNERTTIFNPAGAFVLPGPTIYDTKGNPVFPGGPGSAQNRILDGVLFEQQNGYLMGTDTNGGRWPLNRRESYVLNWNLTLERQLGRGIVLSAGYVGNSGVALQGISLPFCGELATNPQCAPLQQPWLSKGTNVPWVQDNSAHSTYHAGQLDLRKASFDKGYTFQLNYTYSKTLSNNDTAVTNVQGAGSSAGGTDPLDRALDKGRALMDARHLVSFNALYEPPFSKLLPGHKRLITGWQFQAIGTFRSGLPFYLSAGSTESGFGQVRSDRPSILVPYGKVPRGESYNKTFYFSPSVIANTLADNPCTSSAAQYFCYVVNGPGNLGRGPFTDAPFYDADFSIIKNTPITERVKLQLRAEFYNLPNFVNFDNPGGDIFTPGFGQYTHTVNQADPPVTSREIQFGLKFIY